MELIQIPNITNSPAGPLYWFTNLILATATYKICERWGWGDWLLWSTDSSWGSSSYFSCNICMMCRQFCNISLYQNAKTAYFLTIQTVSFNLHQILIYNQLKYFAIVAFRLYYEQQICKYTSMRKWWHAHLYVCMYCLVYLYAKLIIHNHLW